jgi:uncharacterized protein (DUF362 family)
MSSIGSQHVESLTRSHCMLADREVAVSRSARSDYAVAPPFHPPQLYPEFGRFSAGTTIDPTNHVFAAVRDAFRLLGLDREYFGTPNWNPLRNIVHPGDRVVIKPNWVSHSHERNGSWEQIITHGSVIRAVIDYVQLGLSGRGTISLADGPMLNSDFSEICRRTGANAIKAHYDGMSSAVIVELLDLRTVFFETRGQVVVNRHPLPGDPRGATTINLGKHSAFYGFKGEGRYYGADYDTEEVNRHHCGVVQEYQLSGTSMNSDVIIDVPKLKTHHKVGVTLALKGMVGLNCGRNWLPHRTQGTPDKGGDQFAGSGLRQRTEAVIVRAFERASLRFPRTAPKLYRIAKEVGKHLFGHSHRTIRGGGWHGNDTLWRMVHDINRSLLYSDANGGLCQAPIRRRFVVVDGIVAGQGTGPVQADPLPCGLILAGRNPVAVDVVAAELMGFDHGRIPMLSQAFVPHSFPLIEYGASEIAIRSNLESWCGDLNHLRLADTFQFAAPLGWKSYIERCAPSK